MKKNFVHIDILKGIAIILVVIGHFYPQSFQLDSWTTVNKLIYSFHMPLFMVISGYLFANSNFAINTSKYFEFIQKKSVRLLLPYFSISLIIILSKLFAEIFFTLQYPISIQTILFHVFVQPMGGPTTFLWFIYTLWIIFLIFPLLKLILKSDWLILICALIIYNIEFTINFSFDLVSKYLLFFTVGIFLYKFNNYVKELNLSVLIISFIGVALFDIKILIPFIGISLLFLASVIFERYSKSSIIQKLIVIGLCSPSIYLFHTFTMGPIRVLSEKFIGYTSLTFYPITIFTVIGGIILPIYITKIIQKNEKLNLILLGSNK